MQISENKDADSNSEQTTKLPSRRRFLKVALAGAGVLAVGAVGGTGTLLALRGKAPSVAGLQMLTPHEYRTINAIANVHLPQGGAFPIGAADSEIGKKFDAFLAGEPEENVTQLKQALLLFEYGPLVYDQKWATFSNLPPEAQLAHWEGWISSDTLIRRQVALILRKFMSLVFFDQPEVWAHIEYPVPAFSGVEGA